MEEVTVYPVCLADIEAAEDRMYSLRQKTKSPESLKRIDAEIIRLGKRIQEFYSNLPTA